MSPASAPFSVVAFPGAVVLALPPTPQGQDAVFNEWGNNETLMLWKSSTVGEYGTALFQTLGSTPRFDGTLARQSKSDDSELRLDEEILKQLESEDEVPSA